MSSLRPPAWKWTTLVALLLSLGLARDVAAQNPAPAGAYCQLSGVPACAEAGKGGKATVQVTNRKGNPIPGAKVFVGTGIPTTTNNGGRADIGWTCGPAGSMVSISVQVNGQECASATINCYEKDKDGNWITTAAKVAEVGAKVLTKKDVISSSNTLTYGGVEFVGPDAEEWTMGINVTRLDDHRLHVEITSYHAIYPPFVIGPYASGPTTVELKANPANYLVLDEDSGEVYGYLQTWVHNELFAHPQERHLQLTGSYNSDILELSVAGFLIETGPSDAVHDLALGKGSAQR